MEKVTNLVVGCGFSGAVLAHKIATEWNENVLIIDSREHIGGNCYDYWDKNGICVHKHGTHIFHTNLEHVWDFMSSFTKWHPYQHAVKGLVDGMKIPIPFNLNSIDQLFPPHLAAPMIRKLVDTFGFGVEIPILKLRKTGDRDMEFLADYIYEKVFLHYTLKQWGVSPEELDPSVTSRVPVNISRDDRYFHDKYQGIPMEGYTAVFQKMLRHPLIKVRLNTDFHDVKEEIRYERLFFTGSIDSFFHYELGKLPYRSLHFDFIEYDCPYFQSGAVINYPCNYDFTRIGEYKYFLNNQSPRTIVSFEYPREFEEEKNERYYPIIKAENEALYNAYREKADALENTYFLGRLGDYKYYDMDKAIARALELFENVKR